LPSRYRLDLQYDGTAFQGWAKQPGRVTVQGCLEEALTTLRRETPRLVVAGRTDAGVHAWRQVVSLDLESPVEATALLGSLNALTPAGLAVRSLTPAAPGFDARRDALSRSYRYLLGTGAVENPFLSRYSWHVGPGLDRDALAAAATMLVGRHDLTAFTPTETEHVLFRRPVLRCRWRFRGELAWLEIEAPSFLRHMVRVLVGTLVEVGRGKRTPEEFAGLLLGAPREAAGPTAPAQGLFLWRIRYEDGRKLQKGA
jgi:tRNA pseudouridine38-40 synthase